MKKASEYSKICDTEVCVGIKLYETGKVFILSADSTGFWEFLKSKLDSYYPVPKLVTNQDLGKTENSGDDRLVGGQRASDHAIT
ncbi:hypothetical protein N7453_010581 [Penicillium expansum]|nr:hypothetical protein N7453_010581 [Penicillium expansum]